MLNLQQKKHPALKSKRINESLILYGAIEYLILKFDIWRWLWVLKSNWGETIVRFEHNKSRWYIGGSDFQNMVE